MKKRNCINEFKNDYFFLSNFFRLSSGLTLEHYYQAAKTNSLISKFKIMESSSPREAKRIGKTVSLIEDFEKKKARIMFKLVRAKFILYPKLARKLISTGNSKLVEGNYWHDNFWGNCTCNRIQCQKEGKNMLGTILMKVRKELEELL